VNDNASNYSFILGKDLNSLNEALGNFDIVSNKGDKPAEDASAILPPLSSSKDQKAPESYNWNGMVPSSQTGSWSYTQYMRQQ
jgi:hypothetical protein